LERRGALTQFHDPLYEAREIAALGLPPCANNVFDTPDILILNTSHPEYRDLAIDKLAEGGIQAIVDGRGFFNPDVVESHGIRYYGVGKPLRTEPGNDTRNTSNRYSDDLRAAAVQRS
jgi:UDP-N-acetyl-D-mannosaminuronate dehydrogenase